MTTIKELQALLREIGKERQELLKAATIEAKEKWLAQGGCSECDGHGKVVTWSTLDGPSWTEYGPCTNESCTSSTVGVNPSFTPGSLDWRRSEPSPDSWMSAEVSSRCDELASEITATQEAIEAEIARQTPKVGKVVRIVKAGRGRKDRRPKVGAEGLVVNVFHNSWGTEKLIVLDADGVKYWPTSNQVEVIDADPSAEVLAPFTAIQEAEKAAQLEENGYPAVVTVKRATGKASLVVTSNNRELWVPHSQVSELKGARQGQTLSVVFPGWMAEKKGLIKG